MSDTRLLRNLRPCERPRSARRASAAMFVHVCHLGMNWFLSILLLFIPLGLAGIHIGPWLPPGTDDHPYPIDLAPAKGAILEYCSNYCYKHNVCHYFLPPWHDLGWDPSGRILPLGLSVFDELTDMRLWRAAGRCRTSELLRCTKTLIRRACSRRKPFGAASRINGPKCVRMGNRHRRSLRGQERSKSEAPAGTSTHGTRGISEACVCYKRDGAKTRGRRHGRKPRGTRSMMLLSVYLATRRVR